MKILIVDNATEHLAYYSDLIGQFSTRWVESLNLRIKLAGYTNYAERLAESDIVILGSSLGDRALVISRQIKASYPWIQILSFVPEREYLRGEFHAAMSNGVRKVLPDNVPILDLYQEFVAVRAEFCRAGRTTEGRVVVVTSAKGGAGVTSIVAALGEVCDVHGRKALLWDLDVETRDLCRALYVGGCNVRKVNEWITNDSEIDREDLGAAVERIGEHTDILVPPLGMAESMDLVCHTGGVRIAQRVVELARLLYDVCIVDTGGSTGPAAGALMRMADSVIVVVGDGALGLSAVDSYVKYISRVINTPDKLQFLCCRTGVELTALRKSLSPEIGGDDTQWRLPSIPLDPKAADWAGNERTLYSKGQAPMRAALERVAQVLQLLGSQANLVKPLGVAQLEAQTEKALPWWGRMLPALHSSYKPTRGRKAKRARLRVLAGRQQSHQQDVEEAPLMLPGPKVAKLGNGSHVG